VADNEFDQYVALYEALKAAGLDENAITQTIESLGHQGPNYQQNRLGELPASSWMDTRTQPPSDGQTLGDYLGQRFPGTQGGPSKVEEEEQVAGATNEQLAQFVAAGRRTHQGQAGQGMAQAASPSLTSARLGAQSSGRSAMNASKLAGLAEAGAGALDQGGSSMSGWKDYAGLISGAAGTALGIAAPFLERDEEYEQSLRDRAAGDTVARQEMGYAAGEMRRNIMGSAMGRRDISPALAMRNAQMAQSRATSALMAQSAIASAQERQLAEDQLARIRKERISGAIDAGLAGASQMGGFLSSQAAHERQDAMAQKRLSAYQDRTAALRG